MLELDIHFLLPLNTDTLDSQAFGLHYTTSCLGSPAGRGQIMGSHKVEESLEHLWSI